MLEHPAIDPHVHTDEFRLRLLVTDTCNLSCPWCLNDFQQKPKLGQASYLDPDLAKMYVNAYAHTVYSYCGDTQDYPIINISGGEPGMHPHLFEIVKHASMTESVVILNTNGLVLHHMDWPKIRDRIGDLRIHLRPDDTTSYRSVHRGPISFQAVYTGCAEHFEAAYENLIARYGKVKFFVDYNASLPIKYAYVDFIARMVAKYGEDRVVGRFTGRQENRGPLCNGCHKDCVTLKGMWVFPDGTCTPCPQGVHPRNKIIPVTQAYLQGSVYDLMRRAMEGHKKEV